MPLHLTVADHDDLRAYLFKAAETVAFLFAAPGHDALHVEKVQFLRPTDYIQNTMHGVELADHVRPTVIRAAHAHGYAVVEAHAHSWPGPRTRFSPTDLLGLHNLGPHMTWRLPGRPYTALVLGPDSFDALQWHPDGKVSVLDAMLVDGRSSYPTGLSTPHLTDMNLSAEST